MQEKKPATSLILRTCSADMTSTNDFVWPGVGEMAEAPDWEATDECGNGLHGWLYGQGDHSCSSYLSPTAKWLVVEVESDSIIMLGGKCKFPKGIVRFVGDKHGATQFLFEHEPRAREVAVIGASIEVGENEAAVVGTYGTATAGTYGTATAGNSGTATAGDSGTLCIRWYDYTADRYRTEIAYVGEDGIEPNVPYRLDDEHKFVRVEG